MTIELVGTIAEALAALATIAYLAVQIRGSVAATRAEAIRALDSDSNETIRQIATNPGVAEVFRRGLSNPSVLDETESLQFRYRLSHFFTIQDTMWREVKLGTMSQVEFETQFERSWPLFATPGGANWWRRNASLFSPVFREVFERRLASSPNWQA